jgi:hypothetical protein
MHTHSITTNKREQRQNLSIVPIGRNKQRILCRYCFHQRQNHCTKRQENEQIQRYRTDLITLKIENIKFN